MTEVDEGPRKALVRVARPTAASVQETREMLERTQPPDQQPGPDDMRRADDYRERRSSGGGYPMGFAGAHPN